jgi:hypothetical protein
MPTWRLKIACTSGLLCEKPDHYAAHLEIQKLNYALIPNGPWVRSRHDAQQTSLITLNKANPLLNVKALSGKPRLTQRIAFLRNLAESSSFYY